MTQRRKLAFTAALFAVAVALVVASAATKRVAPLFVAWLPLVAVAWILTRPELGEPTPERDPSEPEAGDGPAPGRADEIP